MQSNYVEIELPSVKEVLLRGGCFVAENLCESLPKKKAVLCTRVDEFFSGAMMLFYKGVSYDPHTEVERVLQKAPRLVLVECQKTFALLKRRGVPAYLVTNGRKAWSFLCAEAFGNPQDQLDIYGVTGTNGKTSTVWMMSQLLLKASKPLVIGTLGIYRGEDKIFENLHTTPDPPVLFSLLAKHRDSGGCLVCMEVSSHAIAQEKIAPIIFSGLGFTSFSQDHLDFHASMREYWQTKWKVFCSQLLEEGLAVCQFPAVDQVSFAQQAKKNWLHFALKNPATSGEDLLLLEPSRVGLCYEQAGRSHQLDVPYPGSFNLENFFVAYQMAEFAAKKNGLGPLVSAPCLQPIPGRFEVLSKAPAVVVDFAHTPDALAKALKLMREVVRGKVWVVFGCGGDRDRSKRPKMAAVAEVGADVVVVTSDNPRSEEPHKIIEEVVSGLKSPSCARVVLDRKDAIETIVCQLSPSDGVLIAGKGHENYQIFGDVKTFFDDRVVAKNALLKRKKHV